MAQLVEIRRMNFPNFQIMIASKAARCVLTAGGSREEGEPLLCSILKEGPRLARSHWMTFGNR